MQAVRPRCGALDPLAADCSAHGLAERWRSLGLRQGKRSPARRSKADIANTHRSPRTRGPPSTVMAVRGTTCFQRCQSFLWPFRSFAMPRLATMKIRRVRSPWASNYVGHPIPLLGRKLQEGAVLRGVCLLTLHTRTVAAGHHCVGEAYRNRRIRPVQLIFPLVILRSGGQRKRPLSAAQTIYPLPNMAK